MDGPPLADNVRSQGLGDVKASSVGKFRRHLRRMVKTDQMVKLAHFLRNVAQAWDEATQEQRNRLAKTLFEQILVENNKVVAVEPRHELEHFFELNHKEFVDKLMKWRPRWDSNRLLPENDEGALYPINATDDIQWNGKIDLSQWAELAQKCRTRSLRQIAKEYGVSHETVRRTLHRTGMFDLV